MRGRGRLEVANEEFFNLNSLSASVRDSERNVGKVGTDQAKLCGIVDWGRKHLKRPGRYNMILY
jgi:hypothetical protein